MKVCMGDSDLTLPPPLTFPLLQHLLGIPSLISPASIPFLPYVESSTANASHGSPRWSLIHGSLRYPTKRSAFPEVNSVGALSLSLFFLSCSRALRARSRGSVLGSERSVKGWTYTGWINARGWRTRIAIRIMS